MKDPIYHLDKKLENKIKRLKKDGSKNSRLILEFVNYGKANGISDKRLMRYIADLSLLNKLLKKGFDKADRKDLERVMAEVESKGYSPWSVVTFKSVVRSFYRWLLKDEKKYNKIVGWIKPKLKRHQKKLPSDLLQPEDIKKLIESALNERDKAFVSLLYESGARISEILSLRIEHIRFDDLGAIINIPAGKTGARRIRCVESVPYLKRWLNRHPLKDEPKAPLFCMLLSPKDPLDYANARALLKRLARRAGLKKRIHAHLFRHSRASYLAQYLTEAQMKEYFGWVQGSKMASCYIHLSGKQVDDAILRIYGKAKEDKREERSALAPRICPRCGEENAATNGFCERCGAALTLELALQQQENIELFLRSAVKAALEKEEVRESIKEMIKQELKLSKTK
ncbi:MAG: tyrosine-type recombinase/integrase [Candidatus Diapherotrites archaeon]|nr:tyrosine-type recombinase/integrase [Candidatus Diapherotrites archaeon]